MYECTYSKERQNISIRKKKEKENTPNVNADLKPYRIMKSECKH
jgi:hypothetical protein